MIIPKEEVSYYIPKLSYILGMSFSVYMMYLVKNCKSTSIPLPNFNELSKELGIPSVLLHRAHKEMCDMDIIVQTNAIHSTTLHVSSTSSYNYVLVNKVYINSIIAKTLQVPKEQLGVRSTTASRRKYIKSCIE